ncbi:MAG: hypothetical protein QGG98_07110 [Pseudomonadales bacterium]|nr:hypothetical protein [Pseudomonadales bacterium]
MHHDRPIEVKGVCLDNLSPHKLIKPESAGEAYWLLQNQSRDAWTQELDLRPFSGKW